MTEEETKPFETPWREAEVRRVVDGDTFDFCIDHGFDIHSIKRVRLLGADTWEPRGENRDLGKAATARVEELLPKGSTVRILSHKGGSRGSFRRWLAAVAYQDGDTWVLLGETLIKEGHTKS